MRITLVSFSLSTDNEKPQEPRRRWHAIGALVGGTAAAIVGGLLTPPVQQALGYLLR